MSSPISSVLEKLDGSLLALQSEVDCLRAGLEVSDDQLNQRLAEARQHATTVRDMIRAERADADWRDRKALDLLIHELEVAAHEKLNEQRRNRLLELASEFEAGTIKHRFESRVSALNALRNDAVDQLRADAARPEQEKVLPGPHAGEWLHWACNLQEETDASSLEVLQKDFSALAAFTGEMEESYWVPGTRAPASATPAPQPSIPEFKPTPPREAVRAAKETPPAQPAVPARKETAPAEPVRAAAKKAPPEPVAPARGKPAVAATAASVERPQPATAKTQPATAAKIAEPPPQVRSAPEPARPSAATTHWQAAAVAPAKESPESKPAGSAAATAPATAAPRMKYCDKCGSTYPAQFNVCPIDTSPLRFTSEPAPTGRDGSSVADKVDGTVVGAAAVTAAQAVAEHATAASRESSQAEFAELRETLRHRTEDEPVVEESTGTDWQAMLRDKNWRALAANPIVLAGATLVLVLVVGGILWKAHRSHVSNDSVKAMEKAPEQPAANAQPAGIVPNSAAQPLTTTPSTTNQPKPPDQNAAAAKPNAQNPKDAQTRPDTPPRQDVLSLPMPTGRDVAMAKKPEAPANDAIEPPSAIPGALPNTAPGTLGSIAKDVPVAVPTLSQQKLRVSSGVAQAQLTRRVQPQYPPEALQSRVHGTVVLQAVIGKDGGVKNLKVVSGPPMLIKSATEAVKQWRYKPFTLNGEPVEADTQINVNFTLGEQ